MWTLTGTVLGIMCAILFCCSTGLAYAQDLDLLIKGGHVVDPANSINGVVDVGIADGRITEVARSIPTERARRVVNAAGLYVTPGLIDMHVHVFHGTEQDAYISNSFTSVQPDAFTFRSGVTTAVDVGSAGWRNFRQFLAQTVAHSQTRVLAFLNIVGAGMKGGPIEQNVSDMDPKMTALVAKAHPEVIVGVKLAHYEGHEWTATDRAVEAGTLADLPVMIDFGSATPPLSIEELFFEHLRPGDIFTHAFAHLASREAIVDSAGVLRSFVSRAQARGVVFDVGHGGLSFSYSQAVPAAQQGFWPDVISTDLHTGSMNGAMKDLTNVMSKFLAMGMSLEDVILRTTWKPAQVIKRPDLGNLGAGAVADVAMFSLLEGDFGFVDVYGTRRPGTRRLEAELTLREGRVVWDLNGIASAP